MKDFRPAHIEIANPCYVVVGQTTTKKALMKGRGICTQLTFNQLEGSHQTAFLKDFFIIVHSPRGPTTNKEHKKNRKRKGKSKIKIHRLEM